MTSDGRLDGITVVVTRSKRQASEMTARLQALGAKTAVISTIEIADPLDGGTALLAAVARIDEFDQIVLASPNGARVLVEATKDVDESLLPPVACVGPSTAAILTDSRLQVNVIPERAVAEGLVAGMPAPEAGARLLLVQAEVARDILEIGLTELGWLVERVDAYRTVDGMVSNGDRIAARNADIVTFTSSSTVERFVRLVGADSLPPAIASIGPITSATASDLGLSVDIEADPHTIDGLVDAVVHWAASR